MANKILIHVALEPRDLARLNHLVAIRQASSPKHVRPHDLIREFVRAGVKQEWEELIPEERPAGLE